jgi:hypothetical protein
MSASEAKDDSRSEVSHTSGTYPYQTVDSIVAEFRGKSVHGLAIRLADHARFLEAHCEHWKRLYECAQNANAFRQAALDHESVAMECSECPQGDCSDCPRKPARWTPCHSSKDSEEQ